MLNLTPFWTKTKAACNAFAEGIKGAFDSKAQATDWAAIMFLNRSEAQRKEGLHKEAVHSLTEVLNVRDELADEKRELVEKVAEKYASELAQMGEQDLSDKITTALNPPEEKSPEEKEEPVSP